MKRRLEILVGVAIALLAANLLRPREKEVVPCDCETRVEAKVDSILQMQWWLLERTLEVQESVTTLKRR